MTEILYKCPVCHGSKLLDMGDDVVCNRCDDDGYVHWGKLVNDLEDKVDDVLDKLNDIKEIVDEL